MFVVQVICPWPQSVLCLYSYCHVILYSLVVFCWPLADNCPCFVHSSETLTKRPFSSSFFLPWLRAGASCRFISVNRAATLQKGHFLLLFAVCEDVFHLLVTCMWWKSSLDLFFSFPLALTHWIFLKNQYALNGFCLFMATTKNCPLFDSAYNVYPLLL